MFSERDEVLAG